MLNTKAMDTAVVCGRGGPARKYKGATTKRSNQEYGYNGPSEMSTHEVILYNLILLKKRPILTIGEEGGLGSFSGVGCIFSLARRGE